MKTKTIDHQHPTEKELLLCLIAQDLKSRRFFDCLRELGLDDDYYQSELGDLILIYARLNTESNEVTDFYYNLLGKYSTNLAANNNDLYKAAQEVYSALITFREQEDKPSLNNA